MFKWETALLAIIFNNPGPSKTNPKIREKKKKNNPTNNMKEENISTIQYERTIHFTSKIPMETQVNQWKITK